MTIRNCLITICSALCLCACHRAASDMPDFDNPNGTEMSMQQACDILVQPDSVWTEISGPIAVTDLSGDGGTMNGRAKFVNGQDIRISLRAMGMEVAVIYLDADSVYINDKYHHRSEQASLYEFFGIDGLTISNVQQLLLGQPFAVPDGCTACAWLDNDRLSAVKILTPYGSATAIYANSLETAAAHIAQEVSIQTQDSRGTSAVRLAWKDIPSIQK